MSQAGGLNTSGGVLPPDVPTNFIADSGNAIPVGNNLHINGTGAVSTSAFGNSINIYVAPTSFNWNVVTSANNPVSLTLSNGYIAKGAGVVSFTLPAAASVGDVFKIIGYGNLWTITQNAGQFIRIGTVASTTGIFGNVTATSVTDCLNIICVTANTEFFCDIIQGNPVLV